MSQVKIAINSKSGLVVTPNPNKPEFGFIRVESSTRSLENGFMNNSTRSAVITGKMTDLTAANFKAGEVLPGRIVVKESTTPFYTGQEAKINPTTKQPVLFGGQPVYRDSKYTENPAEVDVLLTSDSKVAASAGITV